VPKFFLTYPEGENWLMGHDWHTLLEEAPIALEYFPASQSKQAALPEA
jgi:hypothetical protein